MTASGFTYRGTLEGANAGYVRSALRPRGSEPVSCLVVGSLQLLENSAAGYWLMTIDIQIPSFHRHLQSHRRSRPLEFIDAANSSRPRPAVSRQRHGVGGANVAQQYLARGLLDELGLHVIPALLGNGARLFDNLGDAEGQLNRSGPSRHPASPTTSTGW